LAGACLLEKRTGERAMNRTLRKCAVTLIAGMAVPIIAAEAQQGTFGGRWPQDAPAATPQTPPVVPQENRSGPNTKQNYSPRRCLGVVQPAFIAGPPCFPAKLPHRAIHSIKISSTFLAKYHPRSRFSRATEMALSGENTLATPHWGDRVLNPTGAPILTLAQPVRLMALSASHP
jgi:hypothetical protein